ncbi:LmbE family N-acetylglucosaminyl deacetylase [Gillisia sp. Hel_I_86]|uniref:PIG-L deacetylase family protein n=1 Tax=Gillisia sp. Hel_I_86 TaxID=1249981 RepID=UPI001198D3A7|nr:PIG-L family deacetylase [Gillisia sp. Hel_I_86]TVZ27179.1 LmbE family N-acetylglucosaminyl deacetylase [Gillisia sp. Hel_I_86]
MKKQIILLVFLLIALPMIGQNTDKKPLNIIAIGAHPDDCDFKFGGTAALFAEMGHNVKFLALTNGDAGHQNMGGGVLAKRRRSEAKRAAEILGIEYEVLDNHDGELLPTLNVRHQVIRKIREWNADIVLGLRSNDYHPDHRNAGIVVQDAAYLVIVPNVAPDTPPLERNPVFLYMKDGFNKPNPFSNDIGIIIDKVFDKKIAALAAHESQIFEWGPWTNGMKDSEVPKEEKERLTWLKLRFEKYKFDQEEIAALKKWYPNEDVSSVQQAEFLEICEYGKQPTAQEIKELFPMLGN